MYSSLGGGGGGGGGWEGRVLTAVAYSCYGKKVTGLYVASSLEVVRQYCVVIITTPTFAYSLVQGPNKCGCTCPIGCYGPEPLMRPVSRRHTP